ncbi:hypothetical protein ZOSMA_78G00960 [Zostera marina]|uniref:Uncharacterized protein n=1 Tax=Zostera marina TaxID=29655 RepID=A0A0K9NQR7_ZOSMR|nr:hypothetical protein ZOSMA_78G00960 [Zostera marina]
MASRVFSRVSKRIVAGGRSIIAPPSLNDPIRRSTGLHSFGCKEMPYTINKTLQQPFVINSTLQRFGISSSASHQSGAGAAEISAAQGIVSTKKKASFSLPGVDKIPPYPLLFRWIDEIIMDYVHHEITRNMVFLYMRLYLIIFMKDVFLAGYDILGF